MLPLDALSVATLAMDAAAVMPPAAGAATRPESVDAASKAAHSASLLQQDIQSSWGWHWTRRIYHIHSGVRLDRHYNNKWGVRTTLCGTPHHDKVHSTATSMRRFCSQRHLIDEGRDRWLPHRMPCTSVYSKRATHHVAQNHSLTTSVPTSLLPPSLLLLLLLSHTNNTRTSDTGVARCLVGYKSRNNWVER
jgi:hypothetical protein